MNDAALPVIDDTTLARIGRDILASEAPVARIAPIWIRTRIGMHCKSDAYEGLPDDQARELAHRALELAEDERDEAERVATQRPPARTDKAPAEAVSGRRVTSMDWRALGTHGVPPLREWIVPGWIPKRHVTLGAGLTGMGKTLLAQQLASAGAAGVEDFIAPGMAPFKTLMWACEDDHDELWRRQVAIAAWLDVGLDAFADRLWLQPRVGEANVLASTEFGRLLFTPQLEALHQEASDLDVDLVVLDNVRHIFGGNENDNTQVTLFVNALMDALRGRTVLLLAHPARAHGSEYAGGAAWENTCRSRLYLGTREPDAPPDEQEDLDTNVRILARRKANYAPRRDLRRYTYDNGVLVPDPIEQGGAGIVGLIREKNAERIVIAAVPRLADLGVDVSNQSNAAGYLPKMIMEYKLAEGATKAELAAAMCAAMVAGKLVRGEVGKYTNGTAKFGLKVAP
jgi:hypothetical protein